MDAVWTPPRSAMSAHFGDRLDKLAQEHGLSCPGESFFDDAGDGVALLLDDPDAAAENWDMAVIFPELLATLEVRPRAAVVPPQQARALQARYGIGRLPSLLFLRDGGYVGVIEGLRDWSELAAESRAMMKKPAGRAPIGIAVSAASAAACRQGGEA